MKLRIALAALAFGSAAAVSAQAAPVSQTATAQAQIVSANTVTATRNLQFGSISKPTSGTNTITVVSSANATTPTIGGGGNATIPTSGQATAATFRITGTPGQIYSIQTNELSFAGATNDLTSVGSESPVAASGTLGTLPQNANLDDLHIGGHFTISPTTAVGVYTGTLNLTVNFN
jgi:hypothetical protein